MKTEDEDGQSMLFLASDLKTKSNSQSKYKLLIKIMQKIMIWILQCNI